MMNDAASSGSLSSYVNTYSPSDKKGSTSLKKSMVFIPGCHMGIMGENA